MLVRRVIPGGQLSLSKYGDGKPREPGAGLVTRRGVPGASPGMVPCPAVVPQRCVGAAGAAQALGVPSSRGLARARATAAALQSVCGSRADQRAGTSWGWGGGDPLGPRAATCSKERRQHWPFFSPYCSPSPVARTSRSPPAPSRTPQEAAGASWPPCPLSHLSVSPTSLRSVPP